MTAASAAGCSSAISHGSAAARAGMKSSCPGSSNTSASDAASARRGHRRRARLAKPGDVRRLRFGEGRRLPGRRDRSTHMGARRGRGHLSALPPRAQAARRARHARASSGSSSTRSRPASANAPMTRPTRRRSCSSIAPSSTTPAPARAAPQLCAVRKRAFHVVCEAPVSKVRRRTGLRRPRLPLLPALQRG